MILCDTCPVSLENRSQYANIISDPAHYGVAGHKEF